VVIDVGAEIGRWSEAVLHLIHPQRLLAIEPTPDSFKALQERLGSVPAVQLENCAIGASPGTAELRIMSHAVFNSLLPVRDEMRSVYSDVAERQTVTVEMRTLDDVAADMESVSILKIDVQGAESAVLDGGKETLRKTTVVVLETNFVSHYEGDTCFDELHARMANEFGFELYRYVGPHHEGGQILFADALYIRPEAISRPPR
jgi:FkbM family methyltransferase